MELWIVSGLLALCCAVLLLDRRRLRRRTHRAEGTLARSESIANELDSKRRFLEAILDTIGDPIFVKDREHRYIYVNEAKCRLNGRDRDAIVGKTDYDFSPPEMEQVDIFVRRDDIVLETGREDINEEALTGADGVLRTVVTRKSLYVDEAGRRCVVGIIRDITKQKQVEEAFKRSQAAYLAEAQKLSATGSFGWNALSGEVFWSDESFRIFGYGPAIKPSIEAMMQRVHPEDVTLVEQAIERAEKEKRDFDFEPRLLMPDGSVKHLHVVAHALPDESGGRQYVGAVMDVTVARRAQDRLNAAQAELAHATRVSVVGQLTASVGHEVSQPLAAIVMNGEASLRFLAFDPPDLDEVRGALNRIIEDGRRGSEIVRRIRALVRKSDVEMAPLDINTVVNDGVSLMRGAMADQRIALNLDLAPGLPFVRGDRVQLQQLVINLMVNGIQAMADIRDRPRALTICSTRDSAGQVLVSVRDSGLGVDPETANRLFDAFYTTKANGMGLGLSICRTIIEAHGGRIWASSNSGPGATFLFSLLPIREGAQGDKDDPIQREIA